MTDVRKAMQIESIDEKLENRLWNTILSSFFENISDTKINISDKSEKEEICVIIWKEFYGNLIDEIPTHRHGISIKGVIGFIREWYFKCEWYEVYDLIEFLSMMDNRALHINFIEECNVALKREMSGYRILDESIVQITTEEEIVEIEDAINNSSIWEPVNIHLRTSIEYFANRDNPDYRNSVKEAISSIESLSVIITGDQNTTLGQALAVIEKKYNIHGALKSAFSSLYGYTSNSGGIRHSLLEDDITVSMEDAKFMIVSCSAFINYLKVKIENS